TLTVHRALADGIALVTLNALLWHIYTSLCRGDQLTATPATPVLPAALDDRLRGRYPADQTQAYLTERTEIVKSTRISMLPQHALTGSCQTSEAGYGTRRIELDTRQDIDLRSLAHRASISLNNLVSAMLLIALRCMLPPAAPGPANTLTLMCSTLIDMRRRV